MLQTGTWIRCGGASATPVGLAAVGGLHGELGDHAHQLQAPHGKNPAGLLAVAFLHCAVVQRTGWHLQVTQPVSACGGTTIPVQAGASMIVGGRQGSELASEEDCGGEDNGEGVWMEMDTEIQLLAHTHLVTHVMLSQSHRKKIISLSGATKMVFRSLAIYF